MSKFRNIVGIVLIVLGIIIIFQQHVLIGFQKEPIQQSSSARAERKQSGELVPFGTITFDNEDRVWILKNFIVPSVANYSYEYNSMMDVSNAPFFIGAEMSPKTGQPFKKCYSLSGECEPPYPIQLK